MAPTPLKRLIAIQVNRETEIKNIGTRFQKRPDVELTKNIVQARLDAIREIWTEIRRTNAEIVGRDDALRDPYVLDNWFERVEENYERILDSMLNKLSLYETADSVATPSESSAGGSHGPKLQRLPLPTFNGRYEDWASFRDLFTSMVHNDPRNSDAAKLQYLKLCLKETAAEFVKDVEVTNANYASTWEALNARFNNPRLRINKLLTCFMEMPQVKRESAFELRGFIDEAKRIVRALSNLSLPVEHWDVWLIFILADRLDSESRKLWEAELSAREQNITYDNDEGLFHPSSLPKFADLMLFLERRCQALSMVAADRSAQKRPASTFIAAPQSRKIFHARSSRRSDSSRCPLCTGTHLLARCSQLKSKNAYDRLSIARRLQVCFNCLGPHRINVCTSAARCSICKNKHHTMLHFGAQQNMLSGADKPRSTRGEHPNSSPPPVNVHTATASTLKRRIILATALVQITNSCGEVTLVRALLDQGSECSFVSESIVQLLGLPKKRTCVALAGVGASAAGTARLLTRIILTCKANASFHLETDALVLPQLTSQIPTKSFNCDNLPQLAELPLADPQFSVAKKVDLILGADVYGQLLRPGLKRFASSGLIAQNTVLGWIISGAVHTEISRRADPEPARELLQVLHCSTGTELDHLLQQFWALEDIPVPGDKLRPDDEACEQLFRTSHSRDSQGRYEVRLPVKAHLPSAAVETRRMALGSLSSMHRRFARDSRLAQAYREFMLDYENLGHMERIPDAERQQLDAWYLPHHAVVQATPNRWRLRVVFDASRKTRDGHFLNDFLWSGPALQGDLSLILLNWRRYRFVFTADIVKMFRQIRVKREDQDFQRIVWAPTPETVPREYRLTTVTYGTACAPFLAIRTLKQLVEDEGSKFPLGAECIRSETYVDDTFAGADDLPTAIRKKTELVRILKSAGIELDKWAANHANLLPSQAQQGPAKQIDVDKSVKTLGIIWNPVRDQFQFNITDLAEFSSASTKRSVLSNIARLFDPLGWLSPITVTAKIFMQDLWIRKCDWDAPLPAELRERWLAYCNSISHLPSLGISRWLGVIDNRLYQVHGFSDASSRAYAAVVYLRVDEGDGRFSVSLLAAKTKVAPVKTVSIPNLELCGAALLVKLVGHVRKLGFLNAAPVFAWSDSQIVLTWLRKHPCHWKTFVANRVSYIQTELPSATWAHVPTKENPADLATRGAGPAELSKTELWWRGPAWLSQRAEYWPQPAEIQRTLHVREIPAEPEILTRFSSLSRLIRIVAFCRRPLLRIRRRKSKQEALPPFLTSSELKEARMIVIRLSQGTSFAAEITELKAGRKLARQSRIIMLNPFLDQDEVLRVGGRLHHANLSFDCKHPPILSKQSALCSLFIRAAHLQCLHGGPTLTSSLLMQQVWILGRNKLVKSILRSCITCQRIKPQSAHQLMGNLPADRVTVSRPFAITGLDYAGPIQVRTTKGRGHRSYKGYIVVFVCFSTKAIHLELVSDLTTPSFISAYRRFVGRRGLCRKLFSDNATNFHGADNELKAMFQRASDFYREVATLIASDGTDWEFIPPSAPHYGGLWEAGVKSVKHHLKRAVGEHTLTFEELSTILVEIEACLNSRPLGALSGDIDDLQALTPFHFLTGASSSLLPDSDYANVAENRLDRFQLLQRLRNQFWKRWSSEYLLHLQAREKWREPTENFSIGRLVLIRDDRYPPSKWPLGRIIEVHPGPDGLVRVATVKTATTVLRRHIHRLCPLYLEEDRKRGRTD